MRNQEQRDKITVEIFIALLVFTLVAVVGVLSLVPVDLSSEVKEGLLGSLVYVVLGGALAAAAVYLWRHRRPYTDVAALSAWFTSDMSDESGWHAPTPYAPVQSWLDGGANEWFRSVRTPPRGEPVGQNARHA